MKNYGLHLMLDGYGASFEKLSDVTLMYEFLCALPAEIGMRRVGFPHIIQFTKNKIAGLSGFTFIAESHISIHTYSKKSFLSLDVYSCKNFNTDKVAKRVARVYGLKDTEIYVQERGKKFHSYRPSTKRGLAT